MNAKFEAAEARSESMDQRLTSRLDAQELRIVVKMGGMLVVLLGLIAALLKVMH